MKKRILGVGVASAVIAVAAAVVPTGLAVASPAHHGSTPLRHTVTCAQLSGESIPSRAIALRTHGATITSAVIVPATTTNGVAYPSYCDVKGSIHPVDSTAGDIDFEIDVPTAWNGSSWQFGGGASDGSIPALTGNNDATPGELPPLAQGYAVYGSDSGHQVPGAGAWVTNDESWLNFAYQQIKKTHDASVWVMESLFGHGPRDNYWVGSSQGGREGLEAISRYPKDYQGAAVEVPLADFSNLLFNPGYQGEIQLKPGGYLPPSKADAVASFVLSQCDALDGLKDGVINDYLDCDQRFDPSLTPHPFAGLRCTGPETDACLTAPEERTLESFYGPIVYPYALSNGEHSYPGWGTGLENVGPLGTFVPLSPWLFSATAPTPGDPAYFGGGGGVLGGQIAQQWFAKQLGDPGFSLLDIDLAKDKSAITLLSQQLDVSSDIHRYLAEGGKLVMVTNASDAISNPRAQMSLYKQWLANPANGGPKRVQASVKYYVVPNEGHVGGAVNASGAPIAGTVDAQRLIQNWVEHRVVPAPVQPAQASAPATNGTIATKPVCVFPEYPRYVGNGANAAGAAAYRCTPPTTRAPFAGL